MISFSRQITDFLLRGNQFYQNGDFDSALKIYLEIEKLDRGYLPALVNIAQCFYEQKNYPQAEDYARRILKLDSDSVPALSLLGCLSFVAEKYDDSIGFFRRALTLDSTDVWNHNYLSQALQKNGEFAAALDEAWTALELSGRDDSQQLNFAYSLYETALEKGTGFISSWQQKWARKYPENSLVRYACAALQNDSKTNRADSDYVRQVFDVFADSFDNALAGLNYRVPQLIADSLNEKKADSAEEKIRILDLGCGTGLVAEKLKKIWPGSVICGVDISAGMLKQAKQKNVYNQLVKGDLETFVFRRETVFDLVVAADVLTYFGELKTIFSGVFLQLKKGGKFIFSVSKNHHDNADWFLHLSGRFLHSENYLKTALSAAGFILKNMSAEILREEGGEPVWGWIVTAQKN